MNATTDVAALPALYFAGLIVVADDCPSACGLRICDLKWPNGKFTTVYVTDGTGGNVVNLPHVPSWLIPAHSGDGDGQMELLEDPHVITMPTHLHGVFGESVKIGAAISTFEFGLNIRSIYVSFSLCFFTSRDSTHFVNKRWKFTLRQVRRTSS